VPPRRPPRSLQDPWVLKIVDVEVEAQLAVGDKDGLDARFVGTSSQSLSAVETDRDRTGFDPGSPGRDSPSRPGRRTQDDRIELQEPRSTLPG
jgi:hypothetical protein